VTDIIMSVVRHIIIGRVLFFQFLILLVTFLISEFYKFEFSFFIVCCCLFWIYSRLSK
jgi:hypothetical protein